MGQDCRKVVVTKSQSPGNMSVLTKGQGQNFTNVEKGITEALLEKKYFFNRIYNTSITATHPNPSTLSFS